MAPPIRLGPRTLGGGPFFPGPLPSGDPNQLPQFRMPSFGNAPTQADILEKTTMSPMLWYWQHNPLAFWPFRDLLSRERIGTNGDRERQIEGGDSTTIPRELPDVAQRPGEPPPTPPGGHPPLGPVGGLLGLIAKHEQLRRLGSRDENTNPSAPVVLRQTSPVGAPNSEGVGPLDQADPNVRRLERVDTTAGRKKLSVESPPLAPDMPDNQPASDPIPNASEGGGNDGDCAKEWSDARQECEDAYYSGEAKKNPFLYGQSTKRNALFSVEDCARTKVREICGGTPLDRGPSHEERRKRNNALFRKRSKGG